MSDILMTGLLIIVAAAALIAVWFQWQSGSSETKAAMIRNAVQTLVEAAEQKFTSPKAGDSKFTYVIARMVQMFPAIDEKLLRDYIEQAVHRMNEGKRSRG